MIGVVSIPEFRTERAGDSYRRSTTGVFLSPIPTSARKRILKIVYNASTLFDKKFKKWFVILKFGW